MADNSEENDREWHLDKKVPITLIAAIVIQTATVVWWARGQDARITALEKGDEGRAGQTSQLTNIAVDIATLKEKTEATNNSVTDIKRSVDLLMTQILQEKNRR